DGIRCRNVTGVQTCALPISLSRKGTQFLFRILWPHPLVLLALFVCSLLIHSQATYPVLPLFNAGARTAGSEKACCTQRSGDVVRSEERRVGKGGGSRWWRHS